MAKKWLTLIFLASPKKIVKVLLSNWCKLRWILAIVAIAGLTAAYWGHFDNGFYFDDTHTIIQNESIKSLENWTLFFTDISTFGTLPTNRGWRPLVTLCNAIDAHLGHGALDQRWFHAHIFLDYILLLVLTFFVLRKMFAHLIDPISSEMWAFATVVVYGFHTANAETVNYIIARSDGYSTLWMMAALAVYQTDRLRKWQLHLIPVALAIMSKESGLMIVPILALYHLYFIERVGLLDLFKHQNWPALKGVTLGVAPAFVFAGVLAYFSIVVMREKTIQHGPLGYSGWEYFHSQFVVVAHYLGNFVWPSNLSVDPYFEVTEPLFTREKVLSFLLIALLHALALIASKGERNNWLPVSFGILWFFIGLAPTSTFKPMAQVANDHRTFMPYLGLSIALVWGIRLAVSQIMKARPTWSSKLAVVMPVCLMSYTTAHAAGIKSRCEVWGSESTLWHDAVLKGPENGRANLNYGLTLMATGQYSETLPYFEKCIEKLPYWPYSHINMAILKGALGRIDEAEFHYAKALEYGHTDPEMYLYNAKWQIQKGDVPEAARLVTKGLEYSPNHAGLKKFLTQIPKTTSPNQMVENLRALCKNQPTPENWLNLSVALYQIKDFQGCIDAAYQALALHPNYDLAYNNICSGHIMLNQYDQAIAACEKALSLRPDFERATNNLNYAKAQKAKK